jgi:hypothetical protein
VKSGHLPTKGRSENPHKYKQETKEKQGLLLYSVRERREQIYANDSEKKTVHSIKRQARGGAREGGLCTGGLLYRQPSHGQYIN